jgi:hypothetical protein
VKQQSNEFQPTLVLPEGKPTGQPKLDKAAPDVSHAQVGFVAGSGPRFRTKHAIYFKAVCFRPVWQLAESWRLPLSAISSCSISNFGGSVSGSSF